MAKSPDIYAALRARYCAPEWALFFEVANGTGGNIRRYADAVAMGLFPSRGLTMNGFEVKASRHDWKRELENPHKAEEGIYKFCHYWWVVAPAGIVPRDELPSTWGLIEFKDGVLRQAIAAPRLKPDEMNRSFIAALLRRASEANESIIMRAVDDRLKADRAAMSERIESEVQHRTSRLREQVETIEAIERQLGMKLTDYHAHEGLGRILKAIDELGVARSYGYVRGVVNDAEGFLTRMKARLAEFDLIAPEVPKPEAPKKDKAA